MSSGVGDGAPGRHRVGRRLDPICTASVIKSALRYFFGDRLSEYIRARELGTRARAATHLIHSAEC